MQRVLRPHQDFRGFAGQITAGTVHPGDEVLALPSAAAPAFAPSPPLTAICARARAPQSVVLTLEDETDISRGDMIASVTAPPHRNQSLRSHRSLDARQAASPRRNLPSEAHQPDGSRTVIEIRSRIHVEHLAHHSRRAASTQRHRTSRHRDQPSASRGSLPRQPRHRQPHPHRPGRQHHRRRGHDSQHLTTRSQTHRTQTCNPRVARSRQSRSTWHLKSSGRFSQNGATGSPHPCPVSPSLLTTSLASARCAVRERRRRPHHLHPLLMAPATAPRELVFAKPTKSLTEMQRLEANPDWRTTMTTAWASEAGRARHDQPASSCAIVSRTRSTSASLAASRPKTWSWSTWCAKFSRVFRSSFSRPAITSLKPSRIAIAWPPSGT